MSSDSNKITKSPNLIDLLAPRHIVAAPFVREADVNVIRSNLFLLKDAVDRCLNSIADIEDRLEEIESTLPQGHSEDFL